MKRSVFLFWLTVGTGFFLSPLAAVAVATAKGSPLGSAVMEWMGHLFEPGYNEFLLVLITSAPFLAAAVFILFHLSTAQAPAGRLAGVAGLLCVGTALSLWILVAIRMSRASTASIGYIFLPFEVLFVMPLGYAAGRLIASWLGKDRPPML